MALPTDPHNLLQSEPRQGWPPELQHEDLDIFRLQKPDRGWLPVPSTIAAEQKFSLIFIIDASHEPQVLLGLKKRGFGKGLWNGFGGKPRLHEPMDECAIRELQEECGLVVHPEDLHARGRLLVVRSVSDEETPVTAEIHLYHASKWQNKPIESEEMRPQWYRLSDDTALPYDQMWPEARFYLPELVGSALPYKDKEKLLCRVDYDGMGKAVGWWMGWTERFTA